MLAWCMRAHGWVVETARNGADALLVASALEPDVIVMDLDLPVVDGLEAIRRLKGDEDTKHIPVVACTGLPRASSETHAVAAGCDGFVAKPCEPEVLRQVLERMVSGRGSGSFA